MSGLSIFGQVDYMSEARKAPTADTSLEPDTSSTTIMATLGISYRF